MNWGTPTYHSLTKHLSLEELLTRRNSVGHLSKWEITWFKCWSRVVIIKIIAGSYIRNWNWAIIPPNITTGGYIVRSSTEKSILFAEKVFVHACLVEKGCVVVLKFWQWFSSTIVTIFSSAHASSPSTPMRTTLSVMKTALRLPWFHSRRCPSWWNSGSWRSHWVAPWDNSSRAACLSYPAMFKGATTGKRDKRQEAEARVFGCANYGQVGTWGIREKILQNAVQLRRVSKGPSSQKL